MIADADRIRESIVRAARANFDPTKLGQQLGERDRSKRASAEQKRARLAELVAESGDMPAARRTLERMLGGNDLVSINYLARGLAAASPVCRVHLRDSNLDTLGFGTGFMVAPGVMMTNHHVISGAAIAAKALAEFDYEDDIRGKAKPMVEFAVLPEPRPIAVEALDFCLVAIEPRSLEGSRVLRDHGWLQLSPTPGKAVVGEYLTIIQHPGGERKQICVRENKLLKYDEAGDTLWYQTDTIGGSSGSPVFNNSWQVVALHHSGVPKTDAKGRWLTLDGEPWDESMDESRVWWIANEGIRISRILEHLGTRHAAHPLARAVLAAPQFQVNERAVRHNGNGTWESRGRNGEMRLLVPVEIAVRVGTPPPAEHEHAEAADPITTSPGIETSGAVLNVRDGLEKVEVEQNYSERPGYDPRFLGSGAVAVPLPTIKNATLARALLSTRNGKGPLTLKYWNYSVVMHRSRKLALFAVVNVDANLRPDGAGRDGDRWYVDTRISENQQLTGKFYGQQAKFESDRTSNPFDRGHLVRRLDAQWGEDEAEAKRNGDDSFHWTNCSPQHHRFNQGARKWLGLEDYVVKSFAGASGRACVISGPVFDAPLSVEADDGRLVPDIDGKLHKDPTFGEIAIPKMFFKIVATRRRGGQLAAAAFLMSQEDFLRTVPRIKGMPPLTEEALSSAEARLYQARVSDVEKLTGLDFGPLAAADTKAFESLSRQLPRVVIAEADIRL